MHASWLHLCLIAGVAQWLESQPSKLVMRVRFPSPALRKAAGERRCAPHWSGREALHRSTSRSPARECSGLLVRRKTSPAANGHRACDNSTGVRRPACGRRRLCAQVESLRVLAGLDGVIAWKCSNAPRSLRFSTSGSRLCVAQGMGAWCSWPARPARARQRWCAPCTSAIHSSPFLREPVRRCSPRGRWGRSWTSRQKSAASSRRVAERGPSAAELLAAFSRALHNPRLIVLEDVHWADEATLDVVRLLGRRVSRLRALVVATYRDDELERLHRLRVAG